MVKGKCRKFMAVIVGLVLFAGAAFAQSNLIADPSWESGALGKWSLNGDGKACFVEENKGNAHTGKFTYKYWLDKAFTSTLTQTFTGLSDGTYEFSIWAMGGGGDNELKIFAKDFGGAAEINAKITNTGWTKWKKYSIKVPVVGGKVTLGIFINAKDGCWGNFDDVSLVKVE